MKILEDEQTGEAGSPTVRPTDSHQVTTLTRVKGCGIRRNRGNGILIIIRHT